MTSCSVTAVPLLSIRVNGPPMDPAPPAMPLLLQFANWSLSFGENGQYLELTSQIPAVSKANPDAAKIRLVFDTLDILYGKVMAPASTIGVHRTSQIYLIEMEET